MLDLGLAAASLIWWLVFILAAVIEFSKYHGAGNDFILVDNRKGQANGLDEQKRHALCRRQLGVGADGIILIERHDTANFFMRYFNADGREGTMCGNGGRCAVVFAARIGAVSGNKAIFFAADGAHEGHLLSPTEVKLGMQPVNSVLERADGSLWLNTGSPHLVVRVPDADSVEVHSLGSKIRYSEEFEGNGVNVNFVSSLTHNSFRIRTYERGVEAETMACGTGVVAAAIAYHHWGGTSTQWEAMSNGGRIQVQFEYSPSGYTQVWKTGPVQFVFDGLLTE